MQGPQGAALLALRDVVSPALYMLGTAVLEGACLCM
jgi:hypothetical protein